LKVEAVSDLKEKLLLLRYASFRQLQSRDRSRSLWMGGWWRSLGILRATKFGKQRSGVVSNYEGRECLIGSGPPDAHCVYVFGGVSSGTPVGADGLHMINLWRKACCHYGHCQIFTSNICLNSLGLFGYWLFQGFCVLLGCSSLRKGALFCQTHVSGAIWPP
jgi:hypothetical protein